MIDINTIKLTTLCDNSVGTLECIGEWGFSVFIELSGVKKILFDTGFRRAVTYNAHVMGITLSEADIIVLSHGHPDHTGGLLQVLEHIRHEAADKEIDILCHPAALQLQYAKHTPEETYIYRGIPHALDELQKLGAKFKCSKNPVWVTDDIVLSGEIPMMTDFESVAPLFFLKKGGEFKRSTVKDDQALFLKTDMGLIVILGCAHRGMINTINYAQKITGIDEIYMVIGGTHLVNTSEKQLSSTLKALKEMNAKKIGVSHCTGMYSASYLVERLGRGSFFFNNAGTQMTFSNRELKVRAFEKN